MNTLRRPMIFGAALIVLATPAHGRQSPDAKPATVAPIPNHHVPEPLTYDLGYIAPGGERTFEVPITNPLDAWVWIKKVTPECPCMEIVESKCEFRPFESGSIRIRFIAPAEPVHYFKRVHLVTSHPQFEHIPITITARVGVPLTFEQASIDLGTLVLGERPEVVIPLINDGEETVRLAYAVSDNRALVPRMADRMVEPGERQVIILALTDRATTTGPKEAHITLHTNCPAQRTVQLAVRWSVNDRLRLQTPFIEVDASASTAQSFQIVFEVAPGFLPPAIRDARFVDLAGLTASVVPAPPTGRIVTLECELEVIGHVDSDAIGGRLLVSLVDRDRPVVIPIRPLAGGSAVRAAR